MPQIIERLLGLYKITNTINQKIYTGQSVDPDARWWQHKNDARRYSSNPTLEGILLIDKKIAQYGVENFIFEVVATCWTFQDANDIETLLVQQYDCHVSHDKGYNVALGGKNAPHSEEWKQQMREWHASLTPEAKAERREKMSIAQQNRDNNYTPEIRQHMSEAHIGITDSEETKQKKAEQATLAWDKRNTIRYADEDIRCHAPGCQVQGKAKYIILDGVRYCSVHGQRLRKHGNLDERPRVAHNKNKPMSEKTKQKLSQSLQGKTPHNKQFFTDEAIAQIMSDTRSLNKIAQAFGTTRKVITRIKSGK